MFGLFSRHKTSGHDKLFFRTDVHSHVCPGIDDGSQSRSKSVGIVGRLNQLGISHMIVTPHVTEDVFENTPETIKKSFARLKEAIDEAEIPVSLHYSAEYRIDEYTRSQLDNNEILPFPNNYVLVECGWLQEPLNLDGFLFELQNKYGFRPILAHPERYMYYQIDRSRYEALHNMGVLLQCNLLSLAGYYDKPCKLTAEWLLEEGMIDLLGTDAHRMEHVAAIAAYVKSRDYLKLYERRHIIKNDKLFGLPENTGI